MDYSVYLPLIQFDHVTPIITCEIISGNEIAPHHNEKPIYGESLPKKPYPSHVWSHVPFARHIIHACETHDYGGRGRGVFDFLDGRPLSPPKNWIGWRLLLQ